jgi:hypothetical protein
MPDRLGGHAPVEAGANLAAAQSSSPIAEIERVALGYERHSPGRSRRRPPLLVTATVRTMRARDAPLTSPRSARVTAVGRRSPGSPRPTVVDRVHDLSSVDSLKVNPAPRGAMRKEMTDSNISSVLAGMPALG